MASFRMADLEKKTLDLAKKRPKLVTAHGGGIMVSTKLRLISLNKTSRFPYIGVRNGQFLSSRLRLGAF